MLIVTAIVAVTVAVTLRVAVNPERQRVAQLEQQLQLLMHQQPLFPLQPRQPLPPATPANIIAAIDEMHQVALGGQSLIATWDGIAQNYPSPVDIALTNGLRAVDRVLNELSSRLRNVRGIFCVDTTISNC